MLKTILSISGKPGLYKLISQGKNMLIVESVSADKKRFPVYDHEKVISLADIAMYTYESEVPLTEVFKSIQKKEEGKAIELDVKKASADQLRDFLGEVLTDFYRERVYPSDIKKLITWYNLLLTNGITDFEEVKKEEAEEATAGEGETAEEK